MNLQPLVIPFLLVLARLTGVLLSAPGFGSGIVPHSIKVALALLLSAVFTPLQLGSYRGPLEGGALPAALAVEFLAGLLIGLAFYWSLAGVAAAGELAGLQMGLGVASTIDPSSGSSALFTQVFFSIVYLVFFTTLDGHHAVLRSLQESFELLPLGRGSARLDSPLLLLQQTGSLLVIGLRLSAGIVIPLLLATFAMALISRAFPQANVFILSFSVTLMLGLLLFAFSGPALQGAARQGIETGLEGARAWMRVLGDGGAPAGVHP